MKRLVMLVSAILTLAAAPTSSPKGVRAIASALTTPLYCISVERDGRTYSTLAFDGTRSPESLAANINNAITLSGLIPVLPPGCRPTDDCDGACTVSTQCGHVVFKAGGGSYTCENASPCNCVKIILHCLQ